MNDQPNSGYRGTLRPKQLGRGDNVRFLAGSYNYQSGIIQGVPTDPWGRFTGNIEIRLIDGTLVSVPLNQIEKSFP